MTLLRYLLLKETFITTCQRRSIVLVFLKIFFYLAKRIDLCVILLILSNIYIWPLIIKPNTIQILTHN